LSKPNILAVKGIHPFYMEALKSQFEVHVNTNVDDPAAFASLAPRITGFAASGESKVPGSLISQMPNLKVISVFGVGYDGVDVAAAAKQGVGVSHTPDVLSDDVADLAMGLLLATSRGIARADQHVRQGQWPKAGMSLATKVTGARLGIVGLGRIGKAIAKRAGAFDMSIAYTARSEKKDSGFTFYASVVDLARNVDFLVVITPGGEGTKHLINAQVLEALGSKGFLINVARGSVVDEEALVNALQKGTIAGAGLDVFANEPNVPEALWSMPQVVLTPHIASATVETRHAMANLAFENMKAGVAGAPLITPVPEMRK
jgi:lactate dehydrogenase-like 2-hydroxyacid dehydrogenase